MTSRNDDECAADEAAVFDFVADFLEDREGGRERSLVDYLVRFPGHEAAIAREYLRLVGQLAEDAHDASAQGTKSETQMSPDARAQRVGHYRLLRELGSGGQGAVWLAEDEHLGRRVALKLLNTPFITAERRGRFRREAESIARLDHPGLAGVHDADLEGAVPWIAMRFVEGQDVRAALDDARARRDPADDTANPGPQLAPLVPFLPATRAELARVLHFFERAARALHAAHEEGVVHRDVKPGNIMVAAPGVPIVLDFGLARGIDRPDVVEEALTREGEIFGTPAYMAPEQFTGRHADLDRRADVWALGVTLYEALVGSRPFSGDSTHVLARAILEQPLPDVRERCAAATLDVKVVLETALERDRARRYASALDFAEDLRRIREFEPVHARPAGPLLRVRRWCRREPAWAASIGVTVMALVFGLAASLAALRRISNALDERNEALAAKETALSETQVALGEKARALDLAAARLFVGQVGEFFARSHAGALALGLEAVRLHDAWWSRASLYEPLEAVTLERQLTLPEGRIWQAALFANGTRLVAGSTGRHIGVFDVASGATLAERTLVGDGKRVEARRILVVDDERGVLIGDDRAVVRRLGLTDLADVWSSEGTTGALAAGGPVQWLAALPGLERTAVVTSELGVVVLDDSTGEERAHIELPPRCVGEASAALLGGELALVLAPRARAGRPMSQGNVAYVVDVGAGTVVAELDAGASIQRSATVSLDGSLRVALGTRSGELHIFTIERGAAGVEVVVHAKARIGDATESIQDVLYLDGRWVVALGRGAELVVFVVPLEGGEAQGLLHGGGEFGVVGLGICELEMGEPEIGEYEIGEYGADEPRGTAGAAAVAPRHGVVAACTDFALRSFALEGGGASDRALITHREEELADHVLWARGARRIVSYGVWRNLSVWRTAPTDAAPRVPLPRALVGDMSARVRAVVRPALAGGARVVEAVVATEDGRVLALRHAGSGAGSGGERPSGAGAVPENGPSEAALGTSTGARWVELARGTPGGHLVGARTGECFGWADVVCDERRDVEVDRGLVVRRWSAAGSPLPDFRVSLSADARGANLACVAFALGPHGHEGALIRGDGSALLLSEDEGPCALQLPIPATALRFSADGTALVLGLEDGGVALFDVPSATLRWHTARVAEGRDIDPRVRAVAFTTDAAQVYRASYGNTLDVLDAATGARVTGGIAQASWIEPLAGCAVFTHATGVNTGRVFECSDATGAPAGTSPVSGSRVEWEKRHDLGVTCIDASPDGRFAVSAALEGSVHVYDPTSGALVALYARHNTAVLALDVGHDGHIVTASDDGTLGIWPIDPVASARRVAPRELSGEERRRLESLLEGR